MDATLEPFRPLSAKPSGPRQLRTWGEFFPLSGKKNPHVGAQARAARTVGQVMFSHDLRDAVANGGITVSVRLWSRPKVKVGARYQTAGVVIEIDALELLPFGALTDDDVRCSGEPDRESLRARAAHAGPITDSTLVYRIEFHVV